MRRADSVRIWLLEYGPCWCRTPQTVSSSFDFVRLRRTMADLGALDENLLIVSERVIDGSAQTYRQVHAEVPSPKLVIAAGTCPTSETFWEELPYAWTPVSDILPVDIHVDDCINGRPESLTAGVLNHVLSAAQVPTVPDEKKVSLGVDERELKHA